MLFLKKSGFAGAALVLAFAGAGCAAVENGSETNPTAEQAQARDVLLKNMEVRGGEAAFAALETMEIFINVSNADYTLDGRYRAVADGRMRIDVFFDGKRVYSEGVDGDGVWEWGDGDEPENVYHEGVGALKRGVDEKFTPLAKFEEIGHKVEYVGRDEIDGINYYAFKLDMDGFETYRFINPDTYHMERERDLRALHPGVDPTKKHLETVHDQWETTNGITGSRRSRNIELETGEVVETATVKKIVYNRPAEELDLSRAYRPE